MGQFDALNGRFSVSASSPAFAEFERELIRERVRAGLDAARARGKRLGRPKRKVDAARIAELRAQGRSWREIAAGLGVGVATARAALLERAKNPLRAAPVSV